MPDRTGPFIYIEQAASARKSDLFDGWATAIWNTLDGEGRMMQCTDDLGDSWDRTTPLTLEQRNQISINKRKD
jgi:hypothetical protein